MYVYMFWENHAGSWRISAWIVGSSHPGTNVNRAPGQNWALRPTKDNANTIDMS